MLRFYLYFNAALYLAFAAWCTFDPVGTAQQVGYLALSPSGGSEYLVVYGGLELGLAVYFFYCASSRAQFDGLLLALALYGPISLYRWITLAQRWPPTHAMLAIGALETLFVSGLALAAIALRQRSTQNHSR